MPCRSRACHRTNLSFKSGYYFRDLPGITQNFYRALGGKQSLRNSCQRIPVQRKGIFPLFLLLLWSAAPAASQPNPAKPLDCTQMIGWLAGGVSSSRLTRLAQKYGIGFAADESALRAMETAGADVGLLKALAAVPVVATSHGLACPEELTRASAFVHQDHYDKAEPILRTLIAKDPQNPALHFALGYVRQQQEDWDEAFDEYSESKELQPGFPETHSRLALNFYHSGDGDNAIAEARTALSIDFRNAEAYRYLGLGLFANVQYRAALHAFEESLARDPGSADAYYDIGITQRTLGNAQAAVNAYRQAVHLNAAFWKAYNNLGIVLHDQGNWNEAVAAYQQAKNLAPDEPSIRNNLGNTYCDKGDYDSAIAEFRELFRMSAEWGKGHGCLAKALMAKQDYVAALPELRLAVGENPTGSAEHRVLGQALLLLHQQQDAVRELRRAVELDPDSSLAHHFLGTAFFQTSQWEAAAREFKLALHLEPSAGNHYSLAACLISLGRYNDALTELESAISLQPDQELYRSRKEELLRLLGAINSPTRTASSGPRGQVSHGLRK